MTGKETDEMATFFAVYTAMCEKVHDPVYSEIRIDADMKARSAKCEAVGAASGRGQPILNPVTGKEHRVGIVLPNGFEYTQNEARLVGIFRRRGIQARRQLRPLVRAASEPAWRDPIERHRPEFSGSGWPEVCAQQHRNATDGALVEGRRAQIPVTPISRRRQITAARKFLPTRPSCGS